MQYRSATSRIVVIYRGWRIVIRSAMRQILIFGTYFLIKENYTVFGLLLMAEVNWLYLIWTEATGNQKECLLRQKKFSRRCCSERSDVLSERCGVKRGRGGRTGVGNGNVYVGFRYNEVKRDLQRTRHFFYSISRRNERLSDLFSKRGGWGYLLSVDYKKEVSKEISLYDIPGRIIGADETGFYYNSGIDYPSAVYRYHFETGENEVFVSKEEAKAAYGKDVFSLSLWDVREEGILFKIWYGEDQRLFLKEADSGKLRQLRCQKNY